MTENVIAIRSLMYNPDLMQHHRQNTEAILNAGADVDLESNGVLLLKVTKIRKTTDREKVFNLLKDNPTTSALALNTDTMKRVPPRGFVSWADYVAKVEAAKSAPAPVEAPAPAPAEEPEAVAAPAAEAPAAKPKAKAAPKVESKVDTPAVETKVVGAPAAETLNEDNDNHVEDYDADDKTEFSIAVDKRPCFVVLDKKWNEIADGLNDDGTDKVKWRKAGVWWFGFKAKNKNGEAELLDLWISSPIHVDAIASDEHGNNYGSVLRFINPKKQWRKWSMPNELLAGSGEELRAELFSMGVKINPDGRQLLMKYLIDAKPMMHVKCVTQLGWSGSSFVLPSAVIGPAAANVIFQSGERGLPEYAQRGSLEGWCEQVAARAVNNPVLMLSLSAAFAGPLLAKVGGESGGLHLVDNSSVGKSTAIKVAASTWGGPKHVRSWNATSNGLEAAAITFNDNLLALDEIRQCAAPDISRVIYGIGNGVSRQRSSRNGAARGVLQYRVFLLSSGERTIATELAAAKIKVMAGQQVRLSDLPVGRKFGCWDDLHGLPNGADFSNALKGAVEKNYGKAGPAFLERLTRDNRKFDEMLADLMRREFPIEGDGGQERRVAARFGLIAMAGEVAVEYGILPWPADAATQAARVMFETWRQHRKSGNAERVQIIEQLHAFIEKHGDSRFSSVKGDVASIRDRAGWWQDDDEGRVYWFHKTRLREALADFEFDTALDTLAEAGILPSERSRKGERGCLKKIRGETLFLYRISPKPI